MLHVPSMEGLAPSSQRALPRRDGLPTELMGARCLHAKPRPTARPAMLPHLYFRCIARRFRVALLRRQCDTAHSIFSREWQTRADWLAFRSVDLPRLDERNLLFLGASAPCRSLGASTACADGSPHLGASPARDRLVRNTALLAGTPDAPCTCCTCWGLTFDMRGRRQLAKPDVARPLDGRVRAHWE